MVQTTVKLHHSLHAFIEPLNPRSDQHQSSPCNINAIYKTEWSQKLRTGLQKMNLLHLSTRIKIFFLQKGYILLFALVYDLMARYKGF